VGPNAKKQQSLLESANNNGYDDDQGSYVHVPHDHVAYRYEVLRMLGKGSFGQVVKVYDHREHVSVALKMVRNEKRFHRQAQVRHLCFVLCTCNDNNDNNKARNDMA